jgi:hypothetical protein
METLTNIWQTIKKISISIFTSIFNVSFLFLILTLLSRHAQPFIPGILTLFPLALSLAHMRFHVHIQVALLGKELPADVTAVRLDTLMLTDVYLQA